MKVPYDEGKASRIGPESCADVRKEIGEALTGERAGRVLSRERWQGRGADGVESPGRQHDALRQGEKRIDPAWSETLRTSGSFLHGNREIPRLPLEDRARGRAVNPKGTRQ